MLRFLAESKKAFSFFSSVFYLSVLKSVRGLFTITIIGRTKWEKKIVYKLYALETVALKVMSSDMDQAEIRPIR
jgi:hypothetical protein